MSTMVAKLGLIRWWELPYIARMTRQNLGEVDQELRRLLRHPLWHWGVRLIGPLYLGLGGRGYKAMLQRQIVGCAFIEFRRQSGYLYNVQVNHDWRRQGVARQLMGHLETAAMHEGYGWTALYVDKANGAARALYEMLGYRPYFSHYWRRRSAADWPAMAGELAQVEPLRRPDAMLLHNYYSQHELFHGDAWAARVVAADFPITLPPGGLHWRCLWAGGEVGFAWGDYVRDRPVLNLYLNHTTWGDAAILAGTLAAIRHAAGWRSSNLDLLLGSSGHGAASLEALTALGFQRRTQSRLLLLKQLPLTRRLS